MGKAWHRNFNEIQVQQISQFSLSVQGTIGWWAKKNEKNALKLKQETGA